MVYVIQLASRIRTVISQIYFWNKTLHVSDSSSVHHQQFLTVHTAMIYVIQLASRIRTLISQSYFWNASDSSSVHHQEFFTVHTAMVYVIQLASRIRTVISQIYFWNKTLHVSDSSSVHHQQFVTVHTAMVYVIQLASWIRTLISQIYFWNKTLHVSDSSSVHHQQFLTVHTAYLYDIYHCRVFVFCGAAAQRGPWPPHFLRFLDHTQRRTAVGRTPLDEWSARRRELYLTTRNTHNWQTSMPPGGIRTHDLSRRAAADLRLRPRGYWDRPTVVCTVQNSWWWTQELSETCRVLLKKIREISASRRFYYKNLSRCTVTWTLNSYFINVTNTLNKGAPP